MRARVIGGLVVVALLPVGCGGIPEACVDAARLLGPAAVAFVDDLPAGFAAVSAEDVAIALDERDGRTIDQVLLEANRLGLGGIDPAPGQDPEEVREGLRLARSESCEIGDLRPTLAEVFHEAAANADDEATAQRYRTVADGLDPEGTPQR